MLIAFEGIDGSGKTSLIKNFMTYTTEQAKKEAVAFKHVSVKFPTDDHIRQVNKGYSSSVANVMLYFSDMRNWVEALSRTVESSHPVYLIDRFFDSTWAYQSLGVKSEQLPAFQTLFQVLKSIACPVLPSFTVYVQIDPSIAVQRIEARGGMLERYEDLSTLCRVKASYEELYRGRSDVMFIDGSKTEKDMLIQFIETYKNVLLKKKELIANEK